MTTALARCFARMAVVLGGTLACWVVPVRAQPADDFYQGREIKLVIGFTTGGGAEIYARTIARHLPNHIRGKPVVTLQFMPGAGSLTAANWIYSVAPKDGSVIASIHSSVTLEPLYGFDRARFDVRQFTWLGSVSTDYGVTLTWGTSPVKTLEQARQRETLVGGLSAGSASDFAAVLLNEFAGTRFKVISGYRGVNDIFLAMERGELDGIGSWAWSSLLSFKPEWLKEGKVNILVQQAIEPHPAIAARGVPFIMDLVKSEDDRRAIELGLAFMAIGRPYVAPPGIPPARAEILRRAFAGMLADPAFLKEAEERKIEITNPKSGAELDQLFERVYATPRPIVERILKLQKMER